MKLSADWFIEGLQDFEYKKYVLLAYLQHVSQEFAAVKLYPSFSDLIFHYKNLESFKENKQKLFNQFPKNLNKEEFQQLKLQFDPKIIEDDQSLEIEDIVNFSLPSIKEQVKEGKEIYEMIDEDLSIEPIGISPLYKNEGYILLKINKHKEVKAFQYKIIFLENTEANYHGISLQYIHSFTSSISMSYENMKLSLVREHTELPNPATFLLYCINPYPEQHSLLPVAKRKFLAYMK